MKNSIESLGRIRTQGLALLFLMFVAGLLVGFAGERVRAARRASALLQPTSGAMARFTDGGLPPMFQQLELTQEQQDRIAVIMENGRPRADAVLNEMLPRLRAITDSLHQEVRAVLTPQQLAAWDSLMTVRRMRHRPTAPGMRGRGPGPGGPPPPMP